MNRFTLFLFFFSSLLLIPSVSVNSQTNGYKDRLGMVKDMVNSSEIIMIWNQGTDQNSQYSQQRVYDLNITESNPDSALLRKPLQTDSMVAGSKKMSVAAGNFLDGSFKNIVAAWQGENNTITVSVPEIDHNTMSWTTSNRLSVPGLAQFGKKKIAVKTGNFFGNRQEEFVLAYEGADTTIHLTIYSFDPNSLVPQAKGSINDVTIMPPGTSLDSWDIVTGDFNSDGLDDIALLYVKPTGGSNWSLYVKLYTVDIDGNLVPKASHEVFQKPAWPVSEALVNGAAGNFDGDASREIAFAFSFSQDMPSEPDTYVYLVDITHNLTDIYTDDTRRITRQELNVNELEPMDVASGDLNKDYRDEIILMSGPMLYVYAADDQMVPQYMSQKSFSTTGDYQNSDEFLEAEDMNRDEKAEIIVAKSFYDQSPGGMQHFELSVYNIDSLLTTYTLRARRMNEEPVLTETGIRNYAIALGDFDGDRVRLGDPVHFVKRGVVEPTVILNTPPIHYDIIDNTVYDLSGCYPDQNCGFTSTYTQSTSFDTTITTGTHEDWGASTSLTIAAGIFKTKVTATYGEKFSNTESSGNSYIITTGRVAAGDDWIYANVYDIDLYEYPVYDSLDTTPIGYFMVSVPGQPQPYWIELKDDDLLGNQFHPDHETGNILSYRTSDTYDTARVIVDFPQQPIGATGNSFASLVMQSFQQNGVETSWDAGAEIGLNIDLEADIYGFDMGLEIDAGGHYNYGEVTTQTVQVQQSLEMRGDLGHLAAQYGTSGTYYVKPYAYWTSYGALALDYTVPALPTGNSFWQTHYGGKTDLAFSLPWRYDQEKGYPFPQNDSTYRYRSRDIKLSTKEPHGGDSIKIAAKVRNYGLEAVSTPFTVRFYAGDPASGGTQIAETTIDTVIAPRSYRTVIVPWLIPQNMQLDNVRIYAVLDQENAVTNEVHEDNNIGWAPALAYGPLLDVQQENTPPQKFILYQSYPNPFNPTTAITFELPSSGNVSLKVYNVLGQEVKTLVNGYRLRGKYSVDFDGRNLASGVYFYRMEVNGYADSRKMILLK